MSHPEIAFHRFFQSLERPADRERYLGKQDLDALEPTLRSLLASVQGAFNEALKNRSNVFGRGLVSNFHVDYVDASVIGAFGFEFDGYAFVAITMPLIEAVWRASDILSRSPEVTGLLQVVPTDSPDNLVLSVLFAAQLSFLIAHEFAHHDRGHLSTRSFGAGIWNDLNTSQVGSLSEQAQELDADGWAVFLQLSHLLLGNGRGVSLSALQIESEPDGRADELLFSLFIVAVCALLFLWPPAKFDDVTVYKLSHPPQAARMEAILANARIWCDGNKPGLNSWMAGNSLPKLVAATERAMWALSGGSTWQQQIGFFRTPAGARYISLLFEQSDAMRKG